MTDKGKITKIELLDFLTNIENKEDLIKNINELPEIIMIDRVKYELYIYVDPIKIENDEYEYELNYYSKDVMEFMFNSKKFNNIETSVYTLLYYLSNI